MRLRGHGVRVLVVFAAIVGLGLGGRPLGLTTVATAGLQSPGSITPRFFAPVVYQTYMVPFVDDFSNPASGWAIKRGSAGTGAYVNGEYLIQVTIPQTEVRATNGLRAGDFQVRVSARSDTPNNVGYGVFFASNTTGAHYTFNVNPWAGTYTLTRFDPSLTPPTTTIIPTTSSPAILTGTTTNILAVTRAGTTISLFVNGTFLIQVVDGTLGSGTVGMEATSFLVAPPAQAYFDNFAFIPTASQPLSVVR